MNIKIPEKVFIINSDAQARLLEEDGTVYTDGDVTPSAGSFILEGFLPIVAGAALELLTTATRIRLDTPQAAVAGAIEVEVLVASGCNAGDMFMVRSKNQLLTPTEMQQYLPLEKRYQMTTAVVAGTDSEDTIVTQMVATINADPNAHVVAAVKAGGTVNSGIIVLTAKTPGETVEFYISDQNAASGLNVAGPTTLTYDGQNWYVLTAALQDQNNYGALKNINWAKNLDFDRNVEYQPEYGASYDSYYFEVNWTPKDVGGHGIPSIDPSQQAGKTAFKLYVKQGLTLNTAMDLLAGDVNV